MILREVKDLLEAKVLACDANLDKVVTSACGADLMSDVLAFSKEKGVLLTGLINPQVIRTAEMLDIKAIVFVRGKDPSSDMIALAEEKDIVLFATEHQMYVSCGILYSHGLGGTEK